MYNIRVDHILLLLLVLLLIVVVTLLLLLVIRAYIRLYIYVVINVVISMVVGVGSSSSCVVRLTYTRRLGNPAVVITSCTTELHRSVGGVSGSFSGCRSSPPRAPPRRFMAENAPEREQAAAAGSDGLFSNETCV